MYIPPFTVSSEAINLIAEIASTIERYAIRMEQSDELRLRKANRIKTIHNPLSDGNGRMGRLWQSLILGKLHPLFEHLPIENMVYANQLAYYDAITESSRIANSSPFIDFHVDKPDLPANSLSISDKPRYKEVRYDELSSNADQ